MMISRREDTRRRRDGSADRKPVSDGSDATVQAPRHGRRTDVQRSSVLGSDVTVTRFPVVVPETNSGNNVKRLLMTKVLINVTVQRSLGSVKVVISSESTVEDLMKAVIAVYVKEKRRPLLNAYDPKCFQLHYSQFSLESLDLNEKLKDTKSRNFFLCVKPTCGTATSIKSSGGHQEKKLTRWPCSLADFMDLLL